MAETPRVGRSGTIWGAWTCASILTEKRQTLYEDFVSSRLVAIHCAGDSATDPFLSALHEGATIFPEELLSRLGAVAFEHGPAVDAAVVAAFPSALSLAPGTDLSLDPRYKPERALSTLSEPAATVLLAEARADLQAVGVATRTALALVLTDLPPVQPRRGTQP